MRIADVNISSGDGCPGALAKETINNIALCHQAFSNLPGCFGTTYGVTRMVYTKVCGQVRGYQKGKPSAFSGKYSIDDTYADGVSITLGNPRKHMWTYGVGYDDHRNTPNRNCPCASSGGAEPASFIGEHYTTVIQITMLTSFLL